MPNATVKPPHIRMQQQSLLSSPLLKHISSAGITVTNSAQFDLICVCVHVCVFDSVYMFDFCFV